MITIKNTIENGEMEQLAFKLVLSACSIQGAPAPASPHLPYPHAFIL